LPGAVKPGRVFRASERRTPDAVRG
jgi:hypothetical protein